ncbi:MAG: MBL fold metallo-hydrolase [Dehalococcoidales bacterium]|nr:MBL fold metallo-hydrolase [Dehalococcoidales bacterium]
MKLTIIYDNESTRDDLIADWGFSCLIEGDDNPTILFDTGADGSILAHNMKALHIVPGDIKIIVISHPHFDHAGGLSYILGLNQDAEIYLPASFKQAIPGRTVTIVTKPIQISQDVFSTGELNGIEQSLALSTPQGILVVAGCSHPGVGNIIDAASRWGKVYGILGGFHGFHNFKRLEGLSLICPCHCTQYKAEIKRRYPKSCLDGGVGQVIEI